MSPPPSEMIPTYQHTCGSLMLLPSLTAPIEFSQSDIKGEVHPICFIIVLGRDQKVCIEFSTIKEKDDVGLEFIKCNYCGEIFRESVKLVKHAITKHKRTRHTKTKVQSEIVHIEACR